MFLEISIKERTMEIYLGTFLSSSSEDVTVPWRISKFNPVPGLKDLVARTPNIT
jgi:hypothetical protein